MLQLSWKKIARHILISQRSSPDDPGLLEYWENRNKIINAHTKSINVCDR